MSTRGLIGFRHNDKDGLAYTHSDSLPDVLGVKILRELRKVDDWDVIRERMDKLVNAPEPRRLDDHSSIDETEIRRNFPNLQ